MKLASGICVISLLTVVTSALARDPLPVEGNGRALNGSVVGVSRPAVYHSFVSGPTRPVEAVQGRSPAPWLGVRPIIPGGTLAIGREVNGVMGRS